MKKLEIIKTSYLSLLNFSDASVVTRPSYRNHNKQLLPSNISYHVENEFWFFEHLAQFEAFECE